ncbi:MAG: hypothetical protein WCT99_04150 [Bacteroidota bacterium]|jgi:hypothetical protein
MINRAILLFILSTSFLHTQYAFRFSLHPGRMLYTSENSSKLLEDKKIKWIAGGSIGLEKNDYDGMTVGVTYDFTMTRINNIVEFYRTSESGPDVISTIGADYLLNHHTVDITAAVPIGGTMSLIAGPSFSWVNRTVVIDDLSSFFKVNFQSSFEDRLASFCAGAVMSLRIDFPVKDGPESPLFSFGVTMRYLHSLWIDARGRNVSGYTQQFLQGQAELGIASPL